MPNTPAMWRHKPHEFIPDERNPQNIKHLDGVEWMKAKKPWRFHRCKTQTFGYTSDTALIGVHRCACGAIRRDDMRRWLEKNSRKKSKVERQRPPHPTDGMTEGQKDRYYITQDWKRDNGYYDTERGDY